MEINRELLFFVSLLGAFNGLFIACYFLFFKSARQLSDIYLGSLLFVLCLRVGKSVFFHFNRELANLYIHIGLMACVLIGPLLFLYIKTSLKKHIQYHWFDALHLIPVIAVFTLAFSMPYHENRSLWRIVVNSIYWQWFVYVLLAAFLLKETFTQLFSAQKIQSTKINATWLVSIWGGVAIIWLAYRTSSFSSYIVGAVSFSFIFYLTGLFFLLRQRNHQQVKAQAKKSKVLIPQDMTIGLPERLEALMVKEKLYKDANLKMPELAKRLKLTPHQLSQYINANFGKNFSQFVNEYRIEEAKRLLIASDKLTIDAIAYDCGFNSISTFYTAFKKRMGQTPAAYKAYYGSLENLQLRK